MNMNTPGPFLTDEEALRQVLEVTRQLAAPTDLREMLAKVMAAAKAVLSADRSSLFLYDQTADELYTTIADGTKEIRLSTSTGLAGECARKRKIINVADCYADARFNQKVDKQTGYRTRCLITVPLVGLDDELVGVMQLLNAARGLFNQRDEGIAEALASQAAVAIQRAMLMEERLVKIKLERDLDLAREIQQDVLPKKLPQAPGYDLAAYAKPADKTGGDIYDVISLPMSHQVNEGSVPKSIMLLLADATGHGIGPALSVTQARAMLRLGLRLNAPLNDLVREVNAQVTEDLSSRRFITAFMGRLDLAQHRVYYHSAGQGPLLQVHAREGVCDFHNASTIPLGIMADLPIEEVQTMDLAPGDMLVLLTDGFFEAHNPDDEQLGMKRISDFLLASLDLSSQAIMDGLVKLLADFCRGRQQEDDLTGVIVKRLAE